MGAGGDVAEHEAFGRPAAEQHVDFAEQLGFGHEVAVLGGELLGPAQGANAARHDGDLVHCVGPGGVGRDQGMAGLVKGHDPFFLGIDHPVFLFQAAHDAVHGLFEVVHVHGVLVFARGEECGFVYGIGQVGAGKAGRLAGDDGKVHARGQHDLFGVDA